MRSVEYDVVFLPQYDKDLRRAIDELKDELKRKWWFHGYEPLGGIIILGDESGNGYTVLQTVVRYTEG